MRMNVLNVRKMMMVSLLLCAFFAENILLAGGVSVEYLKTVGQNNKGGGAIPTLGGKISVDETGNIYCGTPGGASSIIKITPTGRVIWNGFHNVPGFQGTTIDDKYLYTCGAGYYGLRQVQRWDKSSGKKAEGWQHQWAKNEPSKGVRSIGMPIALAVDDNYLYIIDSKGDEVRRLDKKTGKEAPFGKRIMVYKPIDITLSQSKNILILTKHTLLEIDSNGKPLRVPLVDGLKQAVSVDVNPLDGNIYIAEGGNESDLINRVLIFDKHGKKTGRHIGVGGNYQGKWSPETFAFSAGTGDIAFDKNGGLWVNPGWSGKLNGLKVLSFFDKTGKYEKSIISAKSKMAVSDGDLNLYLGGQLKFSNTGNVDWTSGLIKSGNGKDYPYVLANWPIKPSFVDGKLILFVIPNGNIFSLDPKTGKSTGEKYSYQRNGILFSNNKNLFIIKNNTVYSLDGDLKNEKKVFSIPKLDIKELNSADIDNKLQYIYCLYKKGKKQTIRCYQVADGKLCWEKPSGGGVIVCNGFLVTNLPTGRYGKRVMDATTGETLMDIDHQKTTSGRSPVGSRAMTTMVEHKNDVHLFIGVPNGYRLYRFLRENKVNSGGESK